MEVDGRQHRPVRQFERLIAICISTVLIMAGQGVVSPVLPLYADSFGVSTAMVGATVTAFGLARLVTNVPAGMFADRKGRRLLLVGGPLITAIGMLGSGLAGGIWVLLLFRFVAGLGSGLYMTGAQTYLLDIAKPHQTARFVATNQAALLVGVGIGPAIGGLLADAYGLAAPFLVVSASAAVAAIYSYLRLPETLIKDTKTGGADPATASTADALPSRWALLRSTDFLVLGMVTFGVFSIRSGVRQTLVPLQLNREFGLAVDDLGLLFTALGVIGIVLIGPAGWVADRISRKLIIVPTAFMVAAGIGLVAAADTLWLLVAGLAVATVGSSITGPAPAAYVADLVGPDQRGAAMGMYRTAGDFGVVFSPIASGLMADALSISFAIAVNAIFMAAAGIAFWVFATTGSVDRRPAPDRDPAAVR